MASIIYLFKIAASIEFTSLSPSISPILPDGIVNIKPSTAASSESSPNTVLNIKDVNKNIKISTVEIFLNIFSPLNYS